VETLVHSPAPAPGLPESPEHRALLAVICEAAKFSGKIREVLFFAEVLRAHETLFFRQEKGLLADGAAGWGRGCVREQLARDSMPC
jgi:hypothetical protein